MSQQGTEEELAAEVGAGGARPEQASESSIEEASQVSEPFIGEASQVSEPFIGEASQVSEPSTGAPTEDLAGDADAAAGEAPQAAPEDAEDGGDGDPSGPAREVTDAELERELSALLLASPDPLSTARLRKLLGVGKARVEAALLALGERLRAAGLPWELRPIGGGWQLYTTPDMADTVSMLSRVKREEKVSPAALETLAVVAYRQPVTKAEIEAIRGVQVGPVLRTLIDRGLLKIAGRAEVPGSPLLYGTTPRFLDAFGLMQIDDLPRDAELIKD